MFRFTVLAIVVLAILMSPGSAEARKRRGGRGSGGGQSNSFEFDYFLLALSWSPEFCASHPGDKSGQCRADSRRGFVVHGLWQQRQTGRTPACSGTSKVPPELVNKMLAIMPSARLVQHEWEAHGACAGFSMAEYFEKVSQAYRKIRIPTELTAPTTPVSSSVQALEKLFALSNPGLKANQVAVICDREDRTSVAEVRICLDKDLNFRDCGSGIADKCGEKAVLLPVR